ncbi:3'-5' exonuclease [Ensifer sp.]|uniref:3'-5' exonuclease n=1 Tax=Ensifer sp. TaxID=1872086 RepID=UPI0028984AC4|nr:3'-5' exonuclease [Ensifer sp.]
MALQYDMFVSPDPDETGARSRRGSPRAAVGMSAGAMVDHLEATGRYRVLQKLEARPVVSAPRAGFPLVGVILDTETTGLNHRKDEIIEIGLIAFTFDAEGRIGDVIDVYGGLRQPGGPIPPEITRITGITDDMVAGETIDLARVQAIVARADLIIAHNAGFDRPFCEAFSPMFEKKAWACSVSEIGWSDRGFEGTKLGYLIGQAGYFHDGHRAVDDCFALLEVIDGAHEGPQPSPFAELYAASQRSRVRLYAENSPFEMKDHLKGRGYRWSDGSDGRPKSWWIEVGEDALEDELRYLRAEIYRWSEADPPTVRLTAFDRFKAR